MMYLLIFQRKINYFIPIGWPLLIGRITNIRPKDIVNIVLTINKHSIYGTSAMICLLCVVGNTRLGY